MDKRKIIVEKGKSFYEYLNSDDLNLELANNVENLLTLREVIKMKARQTFEETKEKNRVFTFFQPAKSLDDSPKWVYIFSGVCWVILYKAGAVPKFSFLVLFLGLNFFYNWKRQKYCKIQKEYADYKKMNDLYHHIIYLKKKSMTLETFLNKTFKVDFNKFPNEEELKLIKFEYLY